VRTGGSVRIDTVASRDDCERAGAAFDEVWGMRGMVPNEVIIATVHAGAYASLARLDDEVVGASWGFLGGHDGGRTLHSHVTGVLAAAASRGIGASLKWHQWRWARERGLDAITWTFDPLVRRNAYFNLVKLGAVVVEYHEDFYGAINDGLNKGERTDRLVVSWPVRGHDEPPRGDYARTGEWSIATPDDIESLRRSDPASAREWRTRQREELRKAFDGGWRIAGLSRDGSYAIERSTETVRA
jgi:predicted GNAT superfamily acetyltransferase